MICHIVQPTAQMWIDYIVQKSFSTLALIIVITMAPVVQTKSPYMSLETLSRTPAWLLFVYFEYSFINLHFNWPTLRNELILTDSIVDQCMKPTLSFFYNDFESRYGVFPEQPRTVAEFVGLTMSSPLYVQFIFSCFTFCLYSLLSFFLFEEIDKWKFQSRWNSFKRFPLVVVLSYLMSMKKVTINLLCIGSMLGLVGGTILVGCICGGMGIQYILMYLYHELWSAPKTAAQIAQEKLMKVWNPYWKKEYIFYINGVKGSGYHAIKRPPGLRPLVESDRQLLSDEFKEFRSRHEISRRGHLRTPDETLGIARAIASARKREKEQLKQERFFTNKLYCRKQYKMLKSLSREEDFLDPFVDRSTPIEAPKRRSKRPKKKGIPEVEAIWFDLNGKANRDAAKRYIAKAEKKEMLAPHRNLPEVLDDNLPRGLQTAAIFAAFHFDNQNDRYLVKYHKPATILIYFVTMLMSSSETNDAMLTLKFLMDNRNTSKTLPNFIIAQLAVWNRWKRNNAYKVSLMQDKIRSMPVTEGKFSDALDNMHSLTNMFMDSEAMQAIRNIILTVISFRLFDKDISLKIKSLFPHMDGPKTTYDCFNLIIGSLKSLVRMGELWSEGAPITGFFLHEDPCQEALKQGLTLMTYSSQLYYGLPVPGRTCARWFYKESNEIVTTLKYYVDKENPFSARGNATRDLFKKISDIRSEIESTLLGKNRPVPMGIVICSPPGTGKTSVMTLVAHIWSRCKGRQFDPSHVYHNCNASEYHEGYDPLGNPIGHWSEVGDKSDALSQKEVDKSMADILSVCDSQPMLMNMATLERKKNTWCNFEMIMIDTNVERMQLQFQKSRPGATMRRFLFIVPQLDEKFKKPGHETIDPSVEAENYWDKWTFRMYNHEPILDGLDSAPANIWEGRLYDFEQRLGSLMRKHIQYQSAHLEHLNSQLYFENPDGTYSFLPQYKAEDGNFNRQPVPNPNEYDEKEDPALDPDLAYRDWIRHHNILVADFVPPAIDFDVLFDKPEVESEVVDRAIASVNARTERWKNNLLLLINLVNFGGFRSFCDKLVFLSFVLKFALLALKFATSLVILLLTLLGLIVDFVEKSTSSHLRHFVIMSLVYYFGFTPYIFFFLITYIYTFEYVRFVKGRVSDSVDSSIITCKRALDGVRGKFLDLKSYFSSDPHKIELLKYAAAGVAILGGTSMLMKLLFSGISKVVSNGKKKRIVLKPVPENSGFQNLSEEVEKLHDNEDKLECENSYFRKIAVKNTSVWNHQLLNEPSPHTSEFDQVQTKVGRNTRHCIVVNGPYSTKTWCVGLYGNKAVINYHSFNGSERQCFIYMSRVPMCEDIPLKDRVLTMVYVEDLIRIGDDLAIVNLEGDAFADVRSFFSDDLINFVNASGKIQGDDIEINQWPGEMEFYDPAIDGDFVVRDPICYAWDKHAKGQCGTPVWIQVGKGWWCYAIHAAGDDGGLGWAMPLTRKMIDEACSSDKTPLAPMFSRTVERSVSLQKLPVGKSIIRYEDLGPNTYYGPVDRCFMPYQKSKLLATVFSPELDEVFEDIFEHKRETEFYPPLMQPKTLEDGTYINPWNETFRKMTKQKVPLDPRRLQRSVGQIVQQLIWNLDECNIPKLKPWTAKAAINGTKYDAYLRRLDPNKAAGFGLKGKKKDWLDRYILEDEIVDQPVDELIAQINHLVDLYSCGELYGPVYVGCLKDEPRSFEKVVRGKTRVFYITPYAYLIFQRMMLGPFYTLMIQFSEKFYSAIGIDMMRESGKFIGALTSFWEEERKDDEEALLMEGDYGGFDTSMPFGIGQGANTIVLTLLHHLGYNPLQLQLSAGLLADALLPFVDFAGEMINVPALQPSGKYATAEDNSLRNLLIQVYVWNCNPATRDLNFFEHVLPRTYGDDVLSAVSPIVAEHFNGVVFSEAAANFLGLEFTSSSKEAVLTPFVKVADCSFLKRNFSVKEGVGIVGKLHLDSIYKMLQYYIPSNSVTLQDQMKSTCISALWEAFMHLDHDRFQQFRMFLLRTLNSSFPGAIFVLPQYEEILERLRDA